jgi:formate dehydrogenase subunit gamma
VGLYLFIRGNGGKLFVNYQNKNEKRRKPSMSSSIGKQTDVISSALEKYADIPGGLLPLLHEIQNSLGHIPKASVKTIASGMGLSRAEVHGVISFYHDFHDLPRGQKTIHLCRAEACQAMGSRKLEEYVKSRLGIDFGGTTQDGRYTLEPVYCLGNCACSPSIRIGDDVFARVDEDRFEELLDRG